MPSPRSRTEFCRGDPADFWNMVACTLGQCLMMCMRSIPENQQERDNGLMGEKATEEIARCIGALDDQGAT
jgi:hypothetical protein